MATKNFKLFKAYLLSFLKRDLYFEMFNGTPNKWAVFLGIGPWFLSACSYIRKLSCIWKGKRKNCGNSELMACIGVDTMPT